VFVKTASGFEPRSVLMGVNDWEFTEVMRGLEAGDSVVLISVAQLQRAQDEFNQRMRERMGGFPGAGGGPAGGRR
jgi:HlyD family secretion protein